MINYSNKLHAVNIKKKPIPEYVNNTTVPILNVFLFDQEINISHIYRFLLNVSYIQYIYDLCKLHRYVIMHQ